MIKNWEQGTRITGRVFLVVMVLLGVSPAFCGDLYLNLIWHQHQPSYVDPATDQLRGPWVRTHATKDYYDMAAMHWAYPEVHATVNLTSSLLMQLQHYYVDRMAKFVKVAPDGKRMIDADAFLAKWEGKTDPWVDVALRPSKLFTDAEHEVLLSGPWNAFGISRVQIEHFPEYLALRDKPHDQFTTDDFTALKAWFFLAHFDPDFLRGQSKLDVSLADLLEERDGKFYLRHPLTERDANRLVADAVAVMQQVAPTHRKLIYNPKKQVGQLEIITTPFYHPILPLIINTNVARECQTDPLPTPFKYPQDARAQVIKSVDYYRTNFNSPPAGMWPAEGSISEAAAAVFAEAGIKWICGDMHVLQKSKPAGLDLAEPYRVSTPKGDVAIVFRETTISDMIGFTFQNMQPDSAADSLLRAILRYKPKKTEPDRLLTIILDGENAWEWYERDQDAKQFLHGFYQRLTDARAKKTLTCVTPTEYFEGNAKRKVPAHPIASLTALEKLWPGSWINSNFDTWIGEPEENAAWEYLGLTRRDLEASGIPQPDPHQLAPSDARKLEIWKAYEEMYAAEGSDWFWWYGADQGAPGGDRPFEEAYFAHLRAVYDHIRKAGKNVATPDFKPILSTEKIALQESGGVMARSAELVNVTFVCDARKATVSKAIYIVGNLPPIGEWGPNTVTMYDDGTHGDAKAGDGLWSLTASFAVGAEIQYKYTNSGQPGVWQPSEEFAQSNRAFTVGGKAGDAITRNDVFGVRE
jgi:alpha-amylase/alpha-mannosidase (GH57 family)